MSATTDKADKKEELLLPPAKNSLKKATLLKAHSHDDKHYNSGDVIEVSASDYEFLVKHGVAK